MTSTEDTLIKVSEQLAGYLPGEKDMLPHGSGRFPSVEGMKEVMDLVRRIVFPDFFDRQRQSERMRRYSIGVDVEELYAALRRQIESALRFERDEVDEACCGGDARCLALRFVEDLPRLKKLLFTDVEAIFQNDPAVTNYGEIVLSYPVITAMSHYRVAHALHRLGIPALPRILTELAHSATGIDINPGAEIGAYFAIDHGTGVVIGETCIIGEHVTIYQGVTLGAKNFTYDDDGRPKNLPRHPIIEDHVTIYSNASILGRITVGAGSVIGGNVWLTESVPTGSRIVLSAPSPTPITPKK